MTYRATERFIRTSEFINDRLQRCSKKNKTFWRDLFDANERKFKTELAKECSEHAENIILTSKILHNAGKKRGGKHDEAKRSV